MVIAVEAAKQRNASLKDFGTFVQLLFGTSYEKYAADVMAANG